MTETGKPTPVAELLAKYAADMIEAVGRHDVAKHDEREGRSRATAALNDLNTAQRAFDKVVLTMHKAAPVESDWQREVKVATVGGGGNATWSGGGGGGAAGGGGVS